MEKAQNKTPDCINKSIAYFKPPENLTTTEWADKYRKLSRENSAEAGSWKTSRTPYLEEIMNAFTDAKVHRITSVASSQMGKSECELNMLGYAIDIDPGSIMFIMPTVDTAKDFSKRRLAPMIRDTRRLKNKIAESKSRDGENTVLKKAYPGGMLTLIGANSAAALSSVPARYVFGDERDRWTDDASGEGDPWGLVEARTATFYNYKMVEVSSPGIKGRSAIEKSFNLGTMEYWCVECPHCNEYNFIKFDHIKFKYHKEKIDNEIQFYVDSVEYACPACGCASSEGKIRKQPKKWIAKNPDAYKRGHRSFWMNAFSSPWAKWESIILKFLQANGNPQRLKTVYNTLFGELWEDRGGIVDEDELLSRREEYKAELPDGVLCLTCGVDTQDNRLEYEVVGYGHYGENWGIEKGYIMGKPNDVELWERLDGIIDRSWRFESGRTLKISLAFVDSGGHYTQEVYTECNRRINKRVFAIKGRNAEGIPYISPPKRVNILDEYKRIVGKVWLYIIGVDSGKERIMYGLEVQKDGARKSHFPRDEERGYDSAFFNGFLSEKMVYSGGKWKWEKLPGHRYNEALDCRNYANAAFKALNPNLNLLEEKQKGTQEEKKKAIKKRRPVRSNKMSRDDW